MARAIKPRSFEHWNRSLGFSNRVEIQTLQWGKLPLRAANALAPGQNPRLESALLRAENRIQHLQEDPYKHSEDFNQLLAVTRRKINATFWAVAATVTATSGFHQSWEGFPLRGHDALVLGVPLFLVFTAGHYLRNALLEAKIAVHGLSNSEKSLELSRQRYQDLFENAPIGFHNISPEGRILEVNKKWLAIMGYSREEVVGKSIFDFIVPEQRENAKMRFHSRMQGKPLPPLNGDRQYQCKDGSRIFAQTYDADVRDSSGVVVQVQTSFLDLTALRQVEAEREKAAVLRGEMEASALAINGLVHALSQKFTGLLGYLSLMGMNPGNKNYFAAANKISDDISAYFNTFNLFRFGAERGKGFEVGPSAKRIFEDVSAKFDELLARAEILISDDLKKINMSHSIFSVILESLLSNAYEAIEPRGAISLSLLSDIRGGKEGLKI
ncbi:MAG: PAS domain S-box protein, partial [Candidatus Margulisbacteria bacterium]|nr:PAS domain S-box protein [Candidatus Margulisiibacteriota bacterium]